jgi:hypothetical protein
MSFGELLVAPQVWPFSLALFVFGLLVVLEVVMAVVGFGADFGLDADIDLSGHHAGSVFLDWLGVGRVPWLISIAAFLLSFGIIGLFAQAAQFQFVSAAAPWPFVAAGAAALSLPLVRMLNRGLGKLWPKDVESTAVSRDSLIGHEALVVLGRVTAESPGQIKARDEHGTWHYGLAVADTAGAAFEPGDRLLIVARRGSTFAVIRHPNPADGGKA